MPYTMLFLIVILLSNFWIGKAKIVKIINVKKTKTLGIVDRSNFISKGNLRKLIDPHTMHGAFFVLPNYNLTKIQKVRWPLGFRLD